MSNAPYNDSDSQEPRRDISELLESITGHLLRLEDRSVPSAASLGISDGEELVRATLDKSPGASKLANLILSTLRDLADGKTPCDQRISGAMISLTDLIAASVGITETVCDDELVSNVINELELAISQASNDGLSPNVVSKWPIAGGPLTPELLAQFTIESLESLNEAEMALLDLERQIEIPEAINRLFRSIHSIKGTAGYVGLNQIQALSHELENVLSAVRNGRLVLDNNASDLIFKSVDHLKAMVADLTPQGEVTRNLEEFVNLLGMLCGQPGHGIVVTKNSGADSSFFNAANQHLDGLTDSLRSIASGNCSESVLSQLRRAASSLHTSATFVGKPEFAEPAEELLSVVTKLSGVRDRLSSLMGSNSSAAVQLSTTPSINTPSPVIDSPLPLPAKNASPEATNGNGAKPSGNSKSMRVDQKKLDDYMNLAGELVIARNSLVHSLRQFKADRGLKDAVEKICRIVGDVQNNAMGMRMIPVGTVFQRFPRLVRDIAKTLNKQIELDLQGEETELDKQVAEALSDPLIHLVRNAADHGIEAPDARKLAGKREAGVITLRAGREGNTIIIEIQDDGGGIDSERLKAKAHASGIITAEQMQSMSREQALELVFAPGLSTAREISDLSGRGVGMDVVRNNITSLGGSVSIRSEPNQGSCIRLSLPLTLAVTSVVLVESEGMTFGLPIDVVRETLKVSPDSFKRLRGVKAVTLRGDVIPVQPLARLVGQTTTTVVARQESSDRVPVVVLTVGGNRFGVTVDLLKGQQEIVLKPVPPQLGQIEGVSGATIMGDGDIVLVLDPSGLYRRAMVSQKTTNTREHAAVCAS